MLSTLAWRGFALAFGFANFGAMVWIAALRDGAFTRNRSMSEEEKRELAIAQKKFWSVSSSPLPGFKHAFFTLRNGVKIHYVVNQADEKIKARNVAIFVHGFPDSYLLWRKLLQSSKLAEYVLIAVDLPGYGGSDGLDKYDPEGVLEAMTAFVLGMRELYLSSGEGEERGKLVMVTHDWGGIIGARLASEAKELADRWIITSAVLPQHLRSNTNTLLASSRQMLHTYFYSPLRLRLLKSAYTTLTPIISQLKKSFYIFIFNLPYPFCTLFSRFGNFWFLRVLHRVQAGHFEKGKIVRNFGSERERAELLATSSGPGIGQFQEGEKGKGEGYGESVKERIKDLGMSAKIRLYREGLLSGPWEKSLETVVALSEIPVSPTRSNSGAGLFEDGPPGALKVPATIIYGGFDPAFERRLALDGMGDYLTRASQVLMLEKGGHWLPTEERGAEIIEDVAAWALGGEHGSLKEKLGRFADVKVHVDKK